jgi:hypothetical protein
MAWIIPEISSFRLVVPPLQPRVVVSFPDIGCMVSQSFSAGGNQSYLEFWAVTSSPWYLRFLTRQ